MDGQPPSRVTVDGVRRLIQESLPASAGKGNSQQQHEPSDLETQPPANSKLNIDPRYYSQDHFEREVVLRELVEQRFGREVPAAPLPTANAPLQYVTLDQVAAIVKRAKKTVERALNADPEAPQPEIEGGGGCRHEWLWPCIRPWLEKKYKRKLPEQFPKLS